jgi:hypothetical protein
VVSGPIGPSAGVVPVGVERYGLVTSPAGVTLSDRRAVFSPRRVGRFLWAHWYYALLFPFVSIFVTAVHEGAHAIAVIVQGGTVSALRIWPTSDADVVQLGYVHYEGVTHAWLVGIAPCVAWTVVAAGALAVLPRLRGDVVARLVVLALVLAPLRDVSMSLAGFFCRDLDSDLGRTLGDAELVVAPVAVVYFGLFALVGWRQVARRFRPSLGPAEAGALVLVFLAEAWMPQPWTP